MHARIKVTNNYSQMSRNPMSLPGLVSLRAIFKNDYSAEKASVAVKDNSVVFVAQLSVLKVAPLHGAENRYKLVALSSNFEIESLLLNSSQSLLAVVGARSIAVVDVKKNPDFQSSATSWNCFDVCIGPIDPVVKVLWNSAHLSDSELVVLTESEVLVYNIVVSISEPVMRIPFDKFPQLQGQKVVSMSFGSSVNFEGMITLYLSTDQGEIYALHPFLYKGSHLEASMGLIAFYTNDFTNAHENYLIDIPPAISFEPYRRAFLRQSHFVQLVLKMQNLTTNSELTDDETMLLEFDDLTVSPELLGPLVKFPSSAELLMFATNELASLLAAVYKDKKGEINIVSLCQLHHLMFGINLPSEKLQEPVKPAEPLAKKKKDRDYRRPTRGFGFVEDSESDKEDSHDEYQKQLFHYQEELSLFKFKLDIRNYVQTEYNKLSLIRTDHTSVAALKFSLQRLSDYLFAVVCGNAVILVDARNKTQQNFDPLKSKLNIEFKIRPLSFTPNTCAHVQDSIQGSGDFVLAYLCGQPVNLLPVVIDYDEELSTEPKKSVSDQETEAALPKLGALLPAEELQLLLPEKKPVSEVEGFDPENFKSLKLVHQTTADVLKRVGKFTQYLVALQVKLELQMDDLKKQTSNLDSVMRMKDMEETVANVAERVDAMKKRHSELEDREEKIRSKIIARFEKQLVSTTLPMSNAEREWFKELNKITKVISVGDEKTPSLQTTVQNLKQKVDELVKNHTVMSPEDRLAADLEKLLINTTLSRISLNLTQEGKHIASNIAQADYCREKLAGIQGK